MMFRPVPDSLLHFADPTIPGVSGRDLIGRRVREDYSGAPEPVTRVRRKAPPRLVAVGQEMRAPRPRRPRA